MGKALLLLLLITIAGCTTTQTTTTTLSEVSTATTSGTLTRDETWSGTVLVTGDIHVPRGITLTIEPGTTILIKANFDDTGAGGDHILDEITNIDPSATAEYTQTHINFNIDGTLIAVGTPEKKVMFTSDANEPKHTDWDGITFSSSSSGEMKHCVVEWTHTGPALHGTNNVKVSYCEIRHTFWGGLHAFQNSPIFEHNVLEDIGHEGFDTHKASPIIRNNIIRNARTGSVLNYYDLDTNKPLIFENNIVEGSSNTLQLQENAYVIMRNNTFIGSSDTGGPWIYKGFTLNSEPQSHGIALADNVNIEITDNTFLNFTGPGIRYELIGPNEGTGHTTDVPEPFEIVGPINITVTNNVFGNPEDQDYLEDLASTWENVRTAENMFG